MRYALVAGLLFAPAVARADRHVVQRGETLAHVAQGHGCTVEAVERANHLTTTLVAPGTVLEIPACTIASRARTRRPANAERSDDERAREALAVIDGASWITAHDAGPAMTAPRVTTKPTSLDAAPHTTAKPTTSSEAVTAKPVPTPARSEADSSIGEPWDGRLEHGEHLDAGDGYVVRRPARAYGASHVIGHLRRAIAEVRALYPDVHTLAIGDLSAEHGGKISDHRSHQSGLDVDVGFYFTHVPAGYPDGFATADGTLDLEATWALLAAFARTAELDDGVAIIFLDYHVQKRLYDWARARGTPDDQLDALLQYPHGEDAASGLVRHWPAHANHFHVRFKPGR